MDSIDKRKKLVALPMQTVETPEGVILKRGAIEVLISGAQAGQAIRKVLNATGGDGATISELRRLFPQSAKTQVDSIIKNLLDRHLLVVVDDRANLDNAQEDHFDVFFWHFGESRATTMDRFNGIPLTIIGVNSISRQLAFSLTACGHKNFTVIDHPRHRNKSLFDDSGVLRDREWPSSLVRPQAWNDSQQVDMGQCLVATSDFGGQEALCHWNNLCIQQKIHFLPVVLKNMVGYVGPLVIPGETACYECLLNRQRSHSLSPELEGIVDGFAYDGQAIVGFHPAMASMLGDIAVFELTRFYGGSLPEKRPNRLLEVNLIAASMTSRMVLKVPRCSACSPLHTSSETNLSRVLFPDEQEPRP
jgi:bacteriocin biosynthesis cyclodehydratase domain-containing protein